MQTRFVSHFTVCFLLFLLPFVGNSQSTASKQVTTFEMNAPELDADKKLWIYVPKNYNDSRNKYPVIYMHDAQNLFDKSTSYVGEWNVDELLDSIDAQVIVVGIEHGGDKRIEELTPFPNKKYGGGNADKYLDFIVNTLKPKIEKTYRVKKGAKNTAIIGSSLGGLVSYYAALRHPKIFGKVGVFSPSFWYSDEIYKVTEQQKNIKTRMYFLAGDREGEETVPDLEKMYTLVKTKVRNQNQIFKLIVAGGEHNEKLWCEQFLNAYLWLFK